MRAIKYEITIAKDVGGFVVDGTPLNETLVHDLARGNFIAY